jgi:hypothetical protein
MLADDRRRQYTRTMFIAKLVFPALLVGALFVAGCGGDDSGATVTDTADGGESAASTTVADASTATSGGTAGQVDVCAAFSADDAKAVMKALNPAATFDDFAFEAEKVDRPLGGCKFTISGTPTGVIEIDADSADDLNIFRNGSKPLAGIGDEAFTNAGTPYMRVGNVMFSAGEDSFDSQFVIEVFRRMAPKLK